MTSDEIKTFLKRTTEKNNYVKIDFSKRDSLYGIFLTAEKDFPDLSSKNFWRIVTRKHFDEYTKTKSVDLARIFNGSEFTRLSLVTDGF